MYDGVPRHSPERGFNLIVYRTDSGRIISVSPMSERLKVGESIYSRLESREADMLRDISQGFSRLPILCVLGGRTVIAARSLQGKFDIGILFAFETTVDSFLTLAESGRLDLVAIDHKFLGNPPDSRKRISTDTDEQEVISGAYRLMMNSLYNIDVDEDVSGAVTSLTELAGCKVNVSKEDCDQINKMSENEKNNLLVLFFMTFLFVAREGAKRDVNITVDVRHDEPIIIFTSELYNSEAPLGDEALCEFMRIADERGLLCEAARVDNDGEGCGIRIELDPKILDVSLLGIKVRPVLED